MEMNDVIYSFHHNHLLLKKIFLTWRYCFPLALSNLVDKVIVIFFFFSGKSQNQDVITHVGTAVPFLKKVKNFLQQQFLSSFSH